MMPKLRPAGDERDTNCHFTYGLRQPCPRMLRRGSGGSNPAAVKHASWPYISSEEAASRMKDATFFLSLAKSSLRRYIMWPAS